MENNEEKTQEQPKKEKRTMHRIPESLRQTTPFSFRLTNENANKLREIMTASGIENLRVFIEKQVLRLEIDSVIETRRQLSNIIISKEYYKQFRGIATNLNQLVATLNTLVKRDLLKTETSQRLAEQARRILDSIEVFLDPHNQEL